MAVEIRNGFTQVGPVCEMFDSKITIEQANDLRQEVLWNYFENVPVKTPEFTETSDKTLYGKTFDTAKMTLELDQPIMFAGALLRNIDAHTWRLVIMNTKMRRARHNNAQQRIETRYVVEAYENDVVEAVKRVRTVRGVGDLTPEMVVNQEYEEDRHQRRAFERHMTEDDCQQAVECLARVVKRIAA